MGIQAEGKAEKVTLRQWLYRNVYLKSPYWKEIRRRVARRAGFVCEVKGCRAQAANLDAHHTTYDVMGFEWLFIWTLVYLCRYHHNMTHKGFPLDLKGRRKLNPFLY